MSHLLELGTPSALALSTGEAVAMVVSLAVVGLLLSLVLTWALQNMSGPRDGPDPTLPPATTCRSRPPVHGFPVVRPKVNGTGRIKPPPLPPPGTSRRPLDGGS